MLNASDVPVSATSLAKQLNVSRQVIVGDIALLRAADVHIFSTPRGYVMQQKENMDQGNLYTIACIHQGDDGLAEELFAMVDNGGKVLDVIVEHPIYGQLSGQLQLANRYDVNCFVRSIQENQATPLCNLTNGVHLHTVSCPSREVYERIVEALKEKKILFESK